MAKKVKVKKTLVEQILTKAGVDHQGIQINALEGELPSNYDRNHIFKTLALLGDKTGPVIGIGAAATLVVFSKLMDYALRVYHSRVYHFIIAIVLSSTLLILIPNAGNAESINYSGLSLVSYVIVAFFFALGIWLGIWMSQLEDKYK